MEWFRRYYGIISDGVVTRLKNVHRPHMFFVNLRSMTLEMGISKLKMIWLLFMVEHTTQYPLNGSSDENKRWISFWDVKDMII
jgi:hypothetical protein